MSGANLLVIVTGSIAAFKACEAVSQLVQRGHRVRVVATAAALKFVGGATLEGLTRHPVAHDLFEEGAALDHIELARWADVTVVCPATANTLNRLAAGLADDLAGALLLAHDGKKPLLLAPAMNQAMWCHPATRAAVERLQGWGAGFIPVGQGRTACGELGAGRMAEPEEIVAAVEAALVPPPMRRLRVLLTSGGTREPIDGVRVIANTSTGATGAAIADYFARRGHEVWWVRARAAQRGVPDAPGGREGREGREVTFESFAELDAALTRQLGAEDFDAVIHAAAVGDFSVDTIEVDGVAVPPGAGKLSSAVAPTLRLRRNPKLLATLRARSRNPAIRVVAFKLTLDADDAAAAAVVPLLNAGEADWVVHNDLARRAGAGGVFPATIWAAPGEMVARCADRSEIGPALETLLLPARPAPLASPASAGAAPN